MPYSHGHNPGTGITLRYGETLDRSTLDPGAFSVNGKKSGSHKVLINLADDHKTLILRFEQPFTQNEEVRIMMNKEIRTTSGRYLPDLDYWFSIRGDKPEIFAEDPMKSLSYQFSSVSESFINLNQWP